MTGFAEEDKRFLIHQYELYSIHYNEFDPRFVGSIPARAGMATGGGEGGEKTDSRRGMGDRLTEAHETKRPHAKGMRPV